MIKAYVIGSLTQSSLIKKFAMDLPIKYSVRYVYSQPDKDFQDLMDEINQMNKSAYFWIIKRHI